ncbi:phage tail tape measure protein [Pelotomaculum propionicicum]|uniref:phage tail tape measure protein n=1 Tax=Pelotomaculum propionicicum TaxID=258475 RepID=UPI003B7D391B
MTESIKGISIVIGSDTTALTAALSEVNKKSKALQSELKQVEKLLKLDPKNTELVAQKQKLLADAVENAKKKLDSLRKAQEQVNQQFKRGEISQGQYRAFQREVAAAEQQLKKLETQAKNTGTSIHNIGTSMQTAGDKMASAGQNLTMKVTAPIVGVGAAASKMAIEFEEGMAKVGTIADTAAKPIEELRKEILALSNETGTSASELTEAEYQAISAGVETAKSVKFLSTAVKAAKGGFTDSQTAIDGLTTTLNAYGKKADEVTKISDQMMLAQNFGKTTFGEMASSIGNVAPTAASLNVATEDLFGSLAVLTKNGIATSQAVTGLKAAFSNILKPTSDAAKLADQLGLDFSAAHLKSVGWSKFLDEIAEKTGDDAEKMALLFGSVEALNSMLVLTGKGAADFDNVLAGMASSAGLTEEAFRKMENTSGARLAKSLNSLKNAGIELGDSLAPAVESIANSLSRLADWFDKIGPAGQKLIIALAGIAAAIGPVMSIIGNVAKAVGGVIKFFTPAAGGISAFTKVLRFLAPAARIVVTALSYLVRGFSWPVAIITALITIGIALYKHWDTVKAKAQQLGAFIANVWNSLVASVKAVWDGIKNAVVGAWDWMYAHNYYFQKIVDTVTTCWNAIKSVTGSVWNAIKNVAESVGSALSGYLSGLWDSIRGTAQGAWDAIYGVISGILDSISGVFDAALGKAWEWGSNLLGQFIAGIKAKWEAFKACVAEVSDTIAKFLGFHSPTEWGAGRDADKWAPNLIKMFTQGIESGIPELRGTMNRLASMLEIRPIEVSGRMTVTGGVGVNITGEGAQYLRVDSIARAVEQRITEHIAQDSRRYAPIPRTIPFANS